MSESFRRKDRKVIAESKSQKDAARAASSQTDLLGGIHDKLDDVSIGTNLVGEAVEKKSDQVIDELGKGLSDVVAGTELVAEGVERNTNEVKKLSDIASQISDKLSKFTSELESKLSPDLRSANGSQGNTPGTSLAVIEQSIPEIQSDQEKITEALGLLLPHLENNAPDADFYDAEKPTTENAPSEKPAPVPAPKKDDDEEEKKNGKGPSLTDMIGKLVKVTSEGFKSSLGVSNQISSFLFKYSVTAAAEAAKTAAMFLGIVLAIDVIRIQFNYWAGLFEKNFTDFSEKAGEWGPLLTDIITSVNEVVKAFQTGDWSGLVIAIVKGVGKAVYDLVNLIVLGISKLAASIMRSIPSLGGRADDMEGDAIETFQKQTNAKISDEDADKLAKYQAKKKVQEIKQAQNGGDAENTMLEYAKATGQITPEEYKRRKDEANNPQPFLDLSESQQASVMKAQNNAESTINRTSDYLDNIDIKNPNNKKSAEDAVKTAKDTLASKDLDNVPEMKADLEKKYKDLQNKLDTLEKSLDKVSPDSSQESQEAKTSERINSTKSNSSKNDSSNGGTYTNVNNVSNVKKNQFSLPTQTATLAPGTYGHSSQVN